MNECVFCRILAGELPASVVYEDERVTVLLDIRPVNPGHALVISNTHAPSLAELGADDAGELFRAAQRVTAALRSSGLRCEGVNLLLSDGEAAGQDVFHAHLHVIPRYRGDGCRVLSRSPDPLRPSRSELDGIAGRLRDCLLPAQPEHRSEGEP